MKPNQHQERKKGVGRPHKFAEPSRPITLTLPASTLDELQHIDPDRAHAIVKLTKSILRSDGSSQPLVEIVEMAADTGLIVIGLSCALRQISFLHLIEVAPARYLLALDPGHNFESLEIALIDILDDVPGREKRERKLIAQLLQQIKRLRKTERMRMAEILFVRLAGKPSLEAAQR